MLLARAERLAFENPAGNETAGGRGLLLLLLPSAAAKGRVGNSSSSAMEPPLREGKTFVAARGEELEDEGEGAEPALVPRGSTWGCGCGDGAWTEPGGAAAALLSRVRRPTESSGVLPLVPDTAAAASCCCCCCWASANVCAKI